MELKIANWTKNKYLKDSCDDFFSSIRAFFAKMRMTASVALLALAKGSTMWEEGGGRREEGGGRREE